MDIPLLLVVSFLVGQVGPLQVRPRLLEELLKELALLRILTLRVEAQVVNCLTPEQVMRVAVVSVVLRHQQLRAAVRLLLLPVATLEPWEEPARLPQLMAVFLLRLR